MFSPITKTENLPSVGSASEHLNLDFKGAAPFDSPEQRVELAKDIAAFANANGGVILIGAIEGNSQLLESYRPLPNPVALCRAYESAAKDLCRPTPIVSTETIGLPGGAGQVVACNVWPFPAQPVGVSHSKLSKGPAEVYSFPLRVGRHTKYLHPEQLAMIMVPELRRIAILLDAIPPPGQFQDHNLELFCTPGHIRGFKKTIDILSNTVDLWLYPAGTSVYEVSIPLDAITRVWKSSKDTWTITATGRIESSQTLDLRYFWAPD